MKPNQNIKDGENNASISFKICNITPLKIEIRYQGNQIAKTVGVCLFVIYI